MMSFSKAKLKRFNDIADFSSPFSKDKSDKPEKSKKHEEKEKEKEKKESSEDCPASDKKSSKLRLFRTPSLPYRLKFRQVSDLTPSKKQDKAEKQDKACTPINPQTALMFKRCSSMIDRQPTKSRDEKYVEKLRMDIEKLHLEMRALKGDVTTKTEEIDELKYEMDNMAKAEVFLEKVAQQSILKIRESDEKIKDILHNYDNMLHNMDRMTIENENLMALNANLDKSNEEMIKIKEEQFNVLEAKLQTKNEEILKLKIHLTEKLNILQTFEFELGKKTIENFELLNKMEQTEEFKKLFEIQHEESLKMLKNSYENEIFFLNNQLAKCQNQLLKLNKNQKKFQHQQQNQFDLESQIDFENQKTKFEIEKKNYEITLKNYQNIIEILSIRLKKSDGDVEVLMQENCEIKTNYEKLKNSAENLKKNFDEKNQLFDKLMLTSENDMIQMVGKMNNFFNEKFFEIAELKKNFETRDKNLKQMTTTVLEEFSVGIELAKIELDEKQKRLHEIDNENKSIKLENLQLKMKLSEHQQENEKSDATDDEKKQIQQKEAENEDLKQKLKEFDQKFKDIELAAVETERKYKLILDQQQRDSEKLMCFEKLKESNLELKSKIVKLQENYQIFESPTKTTPKKAAMFLGKENQSPIFVGRAFEHSPKNILKSRNFV